MAARNRSHDAPGAPRRKVKELAIYNDYYGFLRSVSGALEDAPGLCRSYRVTSDSELALQLDLVVIDTCVKPVIEEKVSSALGITGCVVYLPDSKPIAAASSAQQAWQKAEDWGLRHFTSPMPTRSWIDASSTRSRSVCGSPRATTPTKPPRRSGRPRS